MTASIKFAAGFLSNLLAQAVRCLWNLVSCATAGVLAAIRALVALLQFAGGGRKRSKETAALCLRSLKFSLKCGLVGLLQGLGVLTFASPLMRGAQACSERSILGSLPARRNDNRSFMQRTLGMNPWEDEKPAEERIEEAATPEPERKRPPTPIQVQVRTDGRPKARAKKKRERPGSEEAEWESLAKKYLECSTIKEMDRIRNRMASEHTARYLNALQAARHSRKSKKAAIAAGSVNI